MSKRIIVVSLSVLGLLPFISFAQTSADVNPSSSGTCLSLVNNMGYRATDATTNGEVTALQDFLNARGYLAVNPTGFYGILTTAAVKQFQTASGVDSTGYTGPYTRAKVAAATCSGTTSTTGGTTTPPPLISGGGSCPVASTQGIPYNTSLPAAPLTNWTAQQLFEYWKSLPNQTDELGGSTEWVQTVKYAMYTQTGGVTNHSAFKVLVYRYLIDTLSNGSCPDPNLPCDAANRWINGHAYNANTGTFNFKTGVGSYQDTSRVFKSVYPSSGIPRMTACTNVFPTTNTSSSIVVPATSPYAGTYPSYTELVKAILATSGSGYTSPPILLTPPPPVACPTLPPPQDFCGQYGNVSKYTATWGQPNSWKSYPAIQFGTGSVWQFKLVVPAGTPNSVEPGRFVIAEYPTGVAGISGAPTTRQLTISRSQCDFRGLDGPSMFLPTSAFDPTGANGPMVVSAGNTATAYYGVGPAKVQKQVSLIPGETYYVSARNWSIDLGTDSCFATNCTAFMNISAAKAGNVEDGTLSYTPSCTTTSR